ncbi:hypothetical protein BZG01_00940 [Labilibaculum manganireducens]|uniref:SH3b domain-containing protein n=1 Tax=Labilibaculum manganireducens TaxID=1940525 RepID=A0A2N3IGT9_9BACT|nr:hypothetical protein [Labilibaculum manganireducens]PKQ69526.1 hypothetical protein BZG01_00940 [Labilibaculum manganireducens]
MEQVISNISGFEKEVLNFILKYNNGQADSIFYDVFRDLIKKFFPNQRIELYKGNVVFKVPETKWEKPVRKLLGDSINTKIHTKNVKRTNDRLLELMQLIIGLQENNYIKFIPNGHIQESYQIGCEGLNVLTKNIPFECEKIIQLLSCKYIVLPSLKSSAKNNFVSVESKNLKITQIALLFTIAVSLIPLTPNGDYFVNAKDVRVRQNPISTDDNTNTVTFLSFGEKIDIVKNGENNFNLIEYSVGDDKKFGWIHKQYIESPPLFGKILCNHRYTGMMYIILALGFLALMIYKIF